MNRWSDGANEIRCRIKSIKKESQQITYLVKYIVKCNNNNNNKGFLNLL